MAINHANTKKGCSGFQKTHGMDGTPTYNSWRAMHKRCKLKTNRSWRWYGGRGISVCERWEFFENFLADMGEKPHNRSLDRIDSRLGYFPENCRWSDDKTQQNNRTNNLYITFQERTLTLSQWSEELGLERNALYLRYYKGDRPPRLFRPVRIMRRRG